MQPNMGLFGLQTCTSALSPCDHLHVISGIVEVIAVSDAQAASQRQSIHLAIVSDHLSILLLFKGRPFCFWVP